MNILTHFSEWYNMDKENNIKAFAFAFCQTQYKCTITNSNHWKIN